MNVVISLFLLAIAIGHLPPLQGIPIQAEQQGFWALIESLANLKEDIGATAAIESVVFSPYCTQKEILEGGPGNLLPFYVFKNIFKTEFHLNIDCNHIDGMQCTSLELGHQKVVLCDSGENNSYGT